MQTVRRAKSWYRYSCQLSSSTETCKMRQSQYIHILASVNLHRMNIRDLCCNSASFGAILTCAELTQQKIENWKANRSDKPLVRSLTHYLQIVEQFAALYSILRIGSRWLDTHLWVPALSLRCFIPIIVGWTHIIQGPQQKP